MKICVTSYGDNLESKTDPRFGRCACFIILDPETFEFEAIANPAQNSGGAAGIQSGKLMSDKNVETVLTGNVGPNAYQTLSAAGIKVFTGVDGTVMDAVKKFKINGYKEADKASVDSHSGI